MRSVLTALGIIIGVAAVIAMVGIGNGAKAQVEAQIASLGQNVILIFSGSTTTSGIRTGLRTQGVDQDDVVIMPFTSAMKRVVGGTTLRNINVQISDGRQIAAAQQQIIALLRQRHNIRAGRDDDFTVRNQQEIADAATATTAVMTVLLEIGR